MKNTFTGLLLLTVCSLGNAQEAQRYVTDDLRANLRSIPNNRGRIVNYLEAGAQLTVLEQNEEGWSRIRTSQGAEGWLRSRYLVDQPVAKVPPGATRQRLEKLQGDNLLLQDAIDEKNAELSQLQAQVNQLTQQRDSTSRELTELRKISGNAIALNTQNQELLKRNSQLESDLEAQTALNDQSRNDQRFQWFIYGSFAVCLGALLTMLITLFKRKHYYSDWG